MVFEVVGVIQDVIGRAGQFIGPILNFDAEAVLLPGAEVRFQAAERLNLVDKEEVNGQGSDFPPETTVVEQSILIRFGIGGHSRIRRETTNWSLTTLIKINSFQVTF